MSSDGTPVDEQSEPSEDQDTDEMMLGVVKFDALSPTQFEEFIFDLMVELGFTNVDWRKGTPKDASPADRGRDIVAKLERRDVDGFLFNETWFVDCKHYTTGVPPDALQSTTSWAQAERPSTVLFVASGYLSNGSKDWIDRYLAASPPFRIRVWEMPQLRRLLVGHLDVAFKHDVSVSELRRVSDILAVESQLFDKLWYGRSPGRDQPIPAGWAPDIAEGMRANQRKLEAKYGLETLLANVQDQFAWGMLSGKISAIRWVLGEEWDMLDS